MSIDVLPSCSASLYEADKPGRHMEPKQPNRRSSKSGAKYETTFVQNTVALAVISKLHKWCCQLFWLTIVCVIGLGCGEQLNSSKNKTLRDVNRRCKTLTDLELQVNFSFNQKSFVDEIPLTPQTFCLRHTRGTPTNNFWRSITLSFQLLRHLTHQTSVHRPLRPILHKKQRHLSRMPSPNLFAIREDDELLDME